MVVKSVAEYILPWVMPLLHSNKQANHDDMQQAEVTSDMGDFVFKSAGVIKPSKRDISEIIIHCSATPAGRDVTVKDIDRWHKQRGWQGIGYHYVVYLDGSVWIGRDVDKIGAHAKGHNTGSIGICYVGGLDSAGHPADTRTVEQKKAMYNLLKSLRRYYPKATIFGHNEVAAKACPCFNARKEYKNI